MWSASWTSVARKGSADERMDSSGHYFGPSTEWFHVTLTLGSTSADIKILYAGGKSNEKTLPIMALPYVTAGFGLSPEGPASYEVYIDDVLVY